jgi:molybdopterin/thiamine biosynthesis adenylyltransferase
MSRFGLEDFSDLELDYYSRTIQLKNMGLKAQRRLKKSTVCLVGLGGLGSPMAMQLASMGVGRLRLVDGDVVEISNLQRQNLYGVSDIGLAKVEAAARRIRDINPFIDLEPTPILVNELNSRDLIEGTDVVIGALDQMAPRYALNRACVDKGIPMVHGAAVAYSGNVSTIIPGATACLECFLGGVDDSTLPSCAVVGVHPGLVNVIGSIMASEAVRLISGTPLLSDKLLFVGFDDLSFETIQLKRVENCPVCGQGKEPSKIVFEEVKEICGREGKRVFVFQPVKSRELELETYLKRMRKMSYQIVARGELGFTFKGISIKGSILKSGVTILEGINNAEEARRTYNQIYENP